MSLSISLAIIDLSKAKTDRLELGKQVASALESTGFLFIDNVPGLDYAKLFQCCKWFFDQPDELKKSVTRNFWNSNNKNVYRGYFPVKPGDPSRKEGFEFARDVPAGDTSVSPDNWFYEKSVWPKEDGKFPFKEFLQETYEIMHNTGVEIMRLASLGLGIPENTFDYMFASKPCSTFRIMHYPPWDGSPPDNAKIEDGKVLITPDHTDTNFLTLLARFGYKGLEVLTQDNEWAEIETRPGSLVMNIGDTLSRMMGGRFKATRHRVIDIGVDRYSVPFFMSPNFEVDVGIDLMSKALGEKKEYTPEKYGHYALRRIKYEKKYFEYRDLPDIK